MNRRNFITALPLSALAVKAALTARADGGAAPAAPGGASIVDSPPILQNPCGDSMNVVWAVKAPATGYVEFGETPALGQKAVTDHFGLNPFDDRFLQTRVTGLAPGKTYYYRAVTVPVTYEGAYKIVLGDAVRGEVCRFTTPSAEAGEATFSVINDTHQNTAALVKIMAKLAALDADYTLWNGDLINDYHTDGQVVANIARPADAAFAAGRPLLFVRGNHDYRGPWCRNLPRLLTPWEHAAPAYRNLGYTFAFRQGPLAIISLDTGEDKPDAHPVFSGMVQYERNMQRQAEWLEETLKRPDIASAPHAVAFCHIPLYAPRPDANPGTTLEGYAAFSGLGQKLWGPLLHKAGVPLVISGHEHRYSFSKPDDGRGWAQLVGGGPTCKGDDPGSPTVIHGRAEAGRLVVTVHNADTGAVRDTFTFQPRTVRTASADALGTRAPSARC